MDSLLLAALLLLLTKPSECRQIPIQTDKFSTVTLSTSAPLDQCSVCELEEKSVADTACVSSVEVKPNKNVNVNFTCLEPEKSFSVLIQSTIACTKTDCTPAQGNVPASLLPGFNRKFEWQLKATAEAVFIVKFPNDGLQELAKVEDCTNGYIYSVNTPSSDGGTQTQSYCTNGSVTHLELPNQATVSVQVNQQQDQDLNLFTVTPESLQKKGHTRMVIPDRDTTVIISRKDGGPDCSVCMDGTCSSKLTLPQNQNRNVTFSCVKPQDIFTVEIIRSLDCSKACSYDMINPQESYFPDFNRLFSWDMKVSADKAFQLEFPAPGIRQIQSSESCPDKNTYTILMYPRTGTVNLGMFCQDGPITRVQVLWRGRMTLEVPKDASLSESSFKFSAASGSELAVVDAVLPRGQSDTDFFSAQSIPSNDIMKWNFFIPPKHNFTVKFLDNTKPKCQSKVVKVIYDQANKDPVEKTLTDTQPINYDGNFSLTLANCDAVRQAGVPGLSLNFRVSVFRGGYPEVCQLDLQSNQGLSLQIDKKHPDSLCELSLDSVVQDNITVPSGSKAKLSFLDCSESELLLTATKTIECQSLSSCPVDRIPLTIPSFDSCTLLRSPPHQVSWVMRVPEQGTVELRSPQGNLHQSVPGKDSDCPMSFMVSEADGSHIGRFCSYSSQGTIDRVQISSNVTITALTSGTQKRNLVKDYLNVVFGSEIKEKLIYSVSPTVSTPVYLITPNWPGAMKSTSTMSWIVNVPEQYSADLAFVNVSWPECSGSDSKIEIQELGSEQGQSYRKDNPLKTINVQNSFYLNMSSCEPQRDHFAVLSKISLQKNSKKLLGIILGVVGALLAIMIIILTVVCLVVRKRKAKDSSMYIPKGAASLPGDFTFPKTRAENESRVYETIDDTMAYGHLLEQDGYTERGPSRYNGQQVDTYQSFTSPMDKNDEPDVGRGALLPPSETFIPSRPRTPLGPMVSSGFEDRRLKDNELGTFKSTGEINTIRLSGVEPWPQPPESVYDQAV